MKRTLARLNTWNKNEGSRGTQTSTREDSDAFGLLPIHELITYLVAVEGSTPPLGTQCSAMIFLCFLCSGMRNRKWSSWSAVVERFGQFVDSVRISLRDASDFKRE